MSFTDQKQRIATEKQCNEWGGIRESSKRFRCYLCGYKFKVGDKWRWINASGGLSNFLVCEKCDGPDVLDKWIKSNKELKEKYWWVT